jgi:hypothetical protein
MKRFALIAVLAVLAVPSLARAQEEKRGMFNGKPYFEATDKVTEQATIIKIDKKGRNVTMVGESADTFTVHCGTDVKNFAQIKVGDVVKATYTEKLTVMAEAPGSPSVTHETTGGAAKAGAKPAASVTERTQVKATITAIDKAAGTATLKGMDGNQIVVTPKHPDTLDKVAVGDMVTFTYTQSIAVSVEKVAKK